MKTQSAAFSLSTTLSDADDVVDSESLTPNILKILPNRSDVLPVNMRCTPCAAVSQYKLCSP